MTAYKSVTLVCDVTGCRRYRVVRVTSTASGLHEARDRVARQGWVCVDEARDLCPVHA